ncbi:MAG: glutamate--cysteine ligase [Candidatus Dasytiphilus stammeri]
MIPNIKSIIPLLESHPEILEDINRGIERETLRVQLNGNIVTTTHPSSLGSALTHKWITTDYAEALLEFITPVSNNVTYLISFLRDLHRHVVHKLDNEHERMWSLSMPTVVNSEDNINVAKYGISNIGKLKTLYRTGLKYRYGSMMQIISGVHYNFSLPLNFWQTCYGIENLESNKEFISASYLNLIRNYYRFGWVIPYLFGASPAISPSFLQGKTTSLDFKCHNNEMLYLPFATSLRLSPLGYLSESQKNLEINFNSLKGYVSSLQKALKTPYDKYTHIGLKKNGQFIQMNTNLLQTENEFYAPIRPKCVIYEGESISKALMRKGIEYVEVRSLDINPFTPIGIDLKQIRFLDLFLLWCLLIDKIEMNQTELINSRKNWEIVALYGRNPEQKIYINKTLIPLVKIGKSIVQELKFLANILDFNNNFNDYKDTCDYIINLFDDPKLTYSSQILNLMKKQGLIKTGMKLSENYHNILLKEDFQILTQEQFNQEVVTSFLLQSEFETTDKKNFITFLSNYNYYKQL